MVTELNESFLEDCLAKLESRRSWSPRVISRFENFIRQGDDYSLFYVNPLAFSREKNIAENEAIDLLLHASHQGLFQIRWQLMCPCCGDRISNFNNLKVLNSRYFCSFCQIETTASLDDFIEVSFSVAPQTRKVRFHNPDTLPIEDYCFKIRLHPGGRVPNGPFYNDLMRDHTKGMAFIPSGENRTFDFEAPLGNGLIHDFANGAGLGFSTSGKAVSKKQNLTLGFSNGGFSAPPAPFHPGRISLTLENQTVKPQAILLLFFPENVPADPLTFEPFLSGKRLLTTKTYHDLFQSDAAPGLDGVGVKDITILFTDLKGSTAMYDRVGDLRAFSLVRTHFTHLEKAINQFEGVQVKTIGDAIMAAFPQPENALKSAIEMVRLIRTFNETLAKPEEIRLKVGLHRGHSIVVSLNERLDYFGQTVNVAARVQGLADADEIFLTEEVHKSQEVRDVLRSYQVTPQNAQLKGVKEEWKVYRFKPS